MRLRQNTTEIAVLNSTKVTIRKQLNRFYLAMNMAKSKKDVEEGYREAKREFNRIPMDKPEQPLRVGIVGE